MSNRDVSTPDTIVRTVTVIMGAVVGLTFLFGFGNVLNSLNLIMFSVARSSCRSAVCGERGDAELDGGVWCRWCVELDEFVFGGGEADA